MTQHILNPDLCGLEKLTTDRIEKHYGAPDRCPGESILKLISGKWKPQIFKIALKGPLRFNALLRQLPGSNKQAIASALHELEDAHILRKEVVQQKPLHIEYHLTERGKSMLSLFKMATMIELDHQDVLAAQEAAV